MPEYDELEESWDYEYDDGDMDDFMTPEGPSDMIVSELLNTPYPQDDADT